MSSVRNATKLKTSPATKSISAEARLSIEMGASSSLALVACGTFRSRCNFSTIPMSRARLRYSLTS